MLFVFVGVVLSVVVFVVVLVLVVGGVGVVGTKLRCYFRLAVVGVVNCFSCRVLFAAGL